jgi:hypothetical protein
VSAVFDTLKFAKRLKEGGFTEQQADTLAIAQVELVGENLATKADIAELRAATKADLNTGLAELKGEIQAMLNRHLLGIIGAMVGLTAIFSAVLLITLRLVVIK